MTAHRTANDAGFGPYTVLDLHELPEDGKGFELEDGWFIETAAGARHNYLTRRLAQVIEAATGGASVFVFDGGEWEISTPSGVRKPDIGVIPKGLARSIIFDESPKLIPGTELLLAVEVISPGSGSERTDRVRKVREYAALGIPQYWLLEQRPEITVQRMVLDDGGGGYLAEPPVAIGSTFSSDIEADKIFRVSFDPGELLDF